MKAGPGSFRPSAVARTRAEWKTGLTAHGHPVRTSRRRRRVASGEEQVRAHCQDRAPDSSSRRRVTRLIPERLCPGSRPRVILDGEWRLISRRASRGRSFPRILRRARLVRFARGRSCSDAAASSRTASGRFLDSAARRWLMASAGLYERRVSMTRNWLGTFDEAGAVARRPRRLATVRPRDDCSARGSSRTRWLAWTAGNGAVQRLGSRSPWSRSSSMMAPTRSVCRSPTGASSPSSRCCWYSHRSSGSCSRAILTFSTSSWTRPWRECQ